MYIPFLRVSLIIMNLTGIDIIDLDRDHTNNTEPGEGENPTKLEDAKLNMPIGCEYEWAGHNMNMKGLDHYKYVKEPNL